MPFTTVASIKTNFNMTLSTHDTLLGNLITQKEKQIKVFCGRDFEQTTYNSNDENSLYDGDGTDTLLLRQFPIVSVTSLFDDPDRSYGASSQISSSDYMIYANEGKIVLDGLTFTRGRQNIKVVYSAGYSTIPEDLKSACEMLVFADYIEHIAQVNTAVSDEIIYKPDKLRAEAWKIIELYKRYA